MADANVDGYDQGEQELARQFFRDALRLIVARGENGEFGTPSSLLPAGTFTESALSWDRGGPLIFAALLKRIRVIRTGGTAGNFDIEIRLKAGGTGMDLVWSAAAVAAPYDHSFVDASNREGVEFLSEEAAIGNRGKISIAIKPNGATASYDVRLYARPLR